MFSATPLILALVAPVILGVKYTVQIVKPLLDAALAHASTDVHDTVIRLFALVLGAVSLPALALAFAPNFHTTFDLTAASVAVAAAFGCAAGLAAVGDWHLIQTLEGGSPSTPIQPVNPPEPTPTMPLPPVA